MRTSLLKHVFVYVNLALILAFPMFSMLTFEAKAQLPSTLTELASGTEIFCIAADSTHVYFTEYSGGTVNRVPKVGGAVQTLVSGENYPWRLVVDGNYVYYIVHEGGLVKRVPKDGGPSEVLADGLTHPWDVATDSDYVYFTVRDGPGLWDDPNGYVARVAKSGGSVQVLAYAQHPNGMAIDSQYVYFTERDIGNIKKVPIGGGAPQTIASGLNAYLQSLAVDTDNVYFVEHNATGSGVGGRVGKVPKNGGTVTILASGQSGPFFVAVDSSWVYFTEYGAGNVKRVSKTGGNLQTLASALDRPSGIAVTSDYLFFSDYDGVYKIAIWEPQRTNWELLYLATGLGIAAAAFGSSTVYFYRKSHPKSFHQPSPVRSTQTKGKICPQCGASLPPDSKFCGKCGNSLE